jgi:hypothetical protein
MQRRGKSQQKRMVDDRMMTHLDIVAHMMANRDETDLIFYPVFVVAKAMKHKKDFFGMLQEAQVAEHETRTRLASHHSDPFKPISSFLLNRVTKEELLYAGW